MRANYMLSLLRVIILITMEILGPQRVVKKGFFCKSRIVIALIKDKLYTCKEVATMLYDMIWQFLSPPPPQEVAGNELLFIS